jgi:hypothetical protein
LPPLAEAYPSCIFIQSENNVPIRAGDIDSALYFWGARQIIKVGTNTINNFPPLNFLFISAFLYLGNGHVIPPVVAIAVVGWLTVVGIYLLAKTLFDERMQCWFYLLLLSVCSCLLHSWKIRFLMLAKVM